MKLNIKLINERIFKLNLIYLITFKFSNIIISTYYHTMLFYYFLWKYILTFNAKFLLFYHHYYILNFKLNIF